MVITFNDEVHVVQGFTSDREPLGKVLDNIEPFGGRHSTTPPSWPSGAWRRTGREQGRRHRQRRRRHREQELVRRGPLRSLAGPRCRFSRSASMPATLGGTSWRAAHRGTEAGRPGGRSRLRAAVATAACPAAVAGGGGWGGGGGRGGRSRPEGLRRQAAHRARRRHRRSGRDPEGPRALHAGKRRASGRRDAPSGGRVDRLRRCGIGTCWLRTARREAETGGRSGSRSRGPRPRAGAKGLLRGSVTVSTETELKAG